MMAEFDAAGATANAIVAPVATSLRYRRASSESLTDLSYLALETLFYAKYKV